MRMKINLGAEVGGAVSSVSGEKGGREVEPGGREWHTSHASIMERVAFRMR